MKALQKKAFTLVELLVVIGIISVLIAILLPALSKAKLAAKDVRCKSQLRQIVMGLTMYAQEYNGYYPDAPLGRGDPAILKQNGWTVAGVPGVGAFDFKESFSKYIGTKALNSVLKCPLASSFWTTDSRANLQTTGGTKGTYVYYFGRDSWDASGNFRNDAKWERSRNMLKISETWSPKSSAGSTLKFNILASDVLYWNGYAGNWLVTTHAIPGKMDGLDEAFINYTGGGKYLPNNPNQASANFAQSDGSVVSHKFNFSSIARRSIIALRSGNQPSSSYYVPAELGR